MHVSSRSLWTKKTKFLPFSGVLKYTGSVNMALIVWIISGVFSMVIILCTFDLTFRLMQNASTNLNFVVHRSHTSRGSLKQFEVYKKKLKIISNASLNFRACERH